MVAINGFCNIEYSVVNSVFSGSVGMSEETYDASKKLALQIAEEGIVLLKNEEKALPLSSDISKLTFLDGLVYIRFMEGQDQGLCQKNSVFL
ncbi:MAG: hypothetical protein ACLUJR_12885 [Mediterraneibacter gnavus]